MLGARMLAVGSGVFTVAVSVVFTLVVTRRLPTEELALLTVFNAGLAVALAVLGYVTVWYPRVLAKEPTRFAELAGAGIVASLAAWAVFAIYLTIYGKMDAVVLLLGLVLLLLHSWPAGAYLFVHRQRVSAAVSYVSQAVKLVGALVVRSYPSAAAVLLINVAMFLPGVLAKLTWPKILPGLRILRELVKGAPYQTLSLAATFLGSITVYAVYLAGGDLFLSYNYILFQVGKVIYPALAISPLMYGSLLIEVNKLKRALLDGAVLLYFHLAAAAVMAKSPEWYVAVLRPSELGSVQLIEAVWLNGAALLVWGIWLHVDTTLKGVEEKTVFTLRDKPAKALVFDIAATPLTITLIYLLARAHGAPGMVMAYAISGSLSAAYRLRLLGRSYLLLSTKLYLPAVVALAIIYAIPIPPLSYVKGGAVETVLTYLPNAAILAAVALGLMAVFSPPTRETLSVLMKRLGCG